MSTSLKFHYATWNFMFQYQAAGSSITMLVYPWNLQVQVPCFCFTYRSLIPVLYADLMFSRTTMLGVEIWLHSSIKSAELSINVLHYPCIFAGTLLLHINLSALGFSCIRPSRPCVVELTRGAHFPLLGVDTLPVYNWACILLNCH